MIAEKTYLKPTTVEQAISFASENEKTFRYLAGGTDVIVNKFQGNNEAECLIDISSISELKQIIKNGKHIKIGSLVRLGDLKKNFLIKNNFYSLIVDAH